MNNSVPWSEELRNMNLTKICVLRAVTVHLCRRYSQEIKKRTIESANLSLIRNIGILAHIDAGKTTTVERMLYYSGTIGQMGEVHHGNTVTDFMDQERQRGITITSASVTFKWGNHQINLLDTPGHIDFTMEVEQTLNVMDGAVVILDGSAGVEAQTVTVWKQADKYDIPRIVYINKMDKPGAGFLQSIDSIQKHLHAVPLTVHLPIINQNKFEGIVDLLSLEKCRWNASALGMDYACEAISPEDGKLWENAVSARLKLSETLADLDDDLAEMIITGREDLERLPGASLRQSLQKVTLERKVENVVGQERACFLPPLTKGKNVVAHARAVHGGDDRKVVIGGFLVRGPILGVVVLCGSSYKNIGVQLLMDGVVCYLPTPLSARSRKIIDCFGDTLCARAFKVRHDSMKGPITFFRIYSGNLSKGQKIHNTKKEKPEQCGRLYVAYADDYEEVPHIGPGNIVAVTGLKWTTTGDLVTSSPSVFHAARKAMPESQTVLSSGTFIPEPVFFCSVEAPSQKLQGALDKALAELEREDPSLRVEVNGDTGQTVLGGMGELHLEVIRERIRSDYKVDAYLGSLQIAYKEALIENAKGSHGFENSIGNSVQSVSVDMSVLTAKEKETGKLLLDKSPECAENISGILPKHLVAVKNGIESALGCGPKLSCPVINVNVMLHRLEVGRGTSESMVASASCQCVRKLLKIGGTRLLEPIMLVEVVCNERTISLVMNDLAKRRAELESSDPRASDVVIRSLVPLSELLGYSKELRILTSGSATFSMEFHSLREMTSDEEAKAIRSVTGFGC